MTENTTIEYHPILGRIEEWKHNNNVWRGTWRWSFVLGSNQAQLDDWFTPTELRSIAGYIDQHREQEPSRA